MALKYGSNSFSNEQLEQLDYVLSCAEELLRALTEQPDYLSTENLFCREEGKNDVFSSADIAVMVAERLSDAGVNCFLPTHIETTASGFDVEFVSDTFAPPIYKRGK